MINRSSINPDEYTLESYIWHLITRAKVMAGEADGGEVPWDEFGDLEGAPLREWYVDKVCAVPGEEMPDVWWNEVQVNSWWRKLEEGEQALVAGGKISDSTNHARPAGVEGGVVISNGTNHARPVGVGTALILGQQPGHGASKETSNSTNSVGVEAAMILGQQPGHVAVAGGASKDISNSTNHARPEAALILGQQPGHVAARPARVEARRPCKYHMQFPVMCPSSCTFRLLTFEEVHAVHGVREALEARIEGETPGDAYIIMLEEVLRQLEDSDSLAKVSRRLEAARRRRG